MAEVAAGAGIPSVMLLTDLNAVLGTSVGSAVEMVETVDFLKGKHQDPRTRELTIEVTADMIRIAGVAPDMAAAGLAEASSPTAAAPSGSGRMIAAGGPIDFHRPGGAVLPRPRRLPHATPRPKAMRDGHGGEGHRPRL
jgi:thymidine phosphorylase